MRQHLNFATLFLGLFCLCLHMGSIPIPQIAGGLIIASELYRCYRIHKQTSHISLDVIQAYYKRDRAYRHFGAKSTTQQILAFANTSPI